jgi:hypothetical protein
MTNSVREKSLSEADRIFSDGIALSHIDKKTPPPFRPQKDQLSYQRQRADDFLSFPSNPGRHSFVVCPGLNDVVFSGLFYSR